MKPIWERILIENEWRTLLADPAFMVELTEGIENMVRTSSLPEEFLLITNWSKDAHEALLLMLPDRLADAFDLSVFRPDGSIPKLDETEGFRLLSGYGVSANGWDAKQLQPNGSPKPLGPYADIAAIQPVALPIRLDRTSSACVRVMPDNDGLVLMVGQFRCGQARRLDNGTFCVEEEVDGGKVVAVLAEEASQNTAADLLLAAGQRHAIELAPLHLTENLYFDTKNGRFLELVSSAEFPYCEDLGDGMGYCPFGCLQGDDGTFLSTARYPSTISCGDDRAHKKRVGSVEDIKALFVTPA